MSFALEMTMAPRLGLEVSPALVTFGEMLMLPYAGMQAVIDDEVAANAALERVDDGTCLVCRGGWLPRCPVCASPGRGPAGAATGPAQPDPATAESDSETLLRAVRMETPAADAAIAEYVVASLDRHGLLDRSCAQLAAELGVAEPRVARVLSVVRRVGPPGVGATTVTESLLLQLDAYGTGDDLTRLARAVIADHLPALAKGHFASIAAALGTSRDEVHGALQFIRQRLRPYPAFDGTGTEPAVYVVPDVVVREDGTTGEYTVELVEPALTRLAVRPDRNRVDGASIAQARSFLAQLRDRWQTLWRIADCAVQRQTAFLRHGPAALVPLTRAEVAVDLGLHESTVSRAVADKYLLLPDRTLVALSRLFGGGGGVDEELRRLVTSAGGSVSDQRLAEQLCAAGYPIARRTVAKRRARLGITAASLR